MTQPLSATLPPIVRANLRRDLVRDAADLAHLYRSGRYVWHADYLDTMVSVMKVYRHFLDGWEKA